MAAQTFQFHATTWWVWAICAAISISVNENLIFVIFLIFLSVLVSKSLITEHKNWKSYLVMIRVAGFILISRIVLQILLGVPVGNQIILRLPELTLPNWITGLRIGGIVTLESLSASLNDSLRLAGLIVVIATAVSLTTTSRVIQQLPVAFHEIGMVIIIAFTFLPHLFADIQRIKQASRWRGQDFGKLKTISHNLVNISESALERSVRLAAALTVRGYGNATQNQNWRKPIYFGLFLLTLEIMRLLVLQPNVFDGLLLAVSAFSILIGIRMAGKVATRTKYRTENWNTKDFSVISLSLLTLIGSFGTQMLHLLITIIACIALAIFVSVNRNKDLVLA
ncbi:MAG: hypothetical protein RLZZ508_582 [Actinomycetota bacterium]